LSVTGNIFIFIFDISIVTTMEERDSNPRSPHKGEQTVPMSYNALGITCNIYDVQLLCGFLALVCPLDDTLFFLYLLSEIAVTQPAFQSHLCMHRAQTPIHGKLSSSSITLENKKGLSYAWKSLGIAKELFFSVRHLEVRRGRLRINAVATLEIKGLVQSENGQKGCDASLVGANPSLQTIQLESSKELDERESLRRMRISKANKGCTPWNKGRKHSAGNYMLIEPASVFISLFSLLCFTNSSTIHFIGRNPSSDQRENKARNAGS
jgi:hypothetical protein